MIRLAWRQFRTQAVVAFGALVIVAVVFAITGPTLVHIYDTSVAACRTNRGPGEECVNPLLGKFSNLQAIGPALLLIVPALIGIFWGAPLVAHELETGTFRLAFTQSVSRTRWFAVKVGVVGLSSIAVAGLLSLIVTWWSSPIDMVNANRFGTLVFSLRGIVPIGYAAFAFSLGVTAGVLIRRTLPAMAITLVAFVSGRLAVTYWVRPHLIAPLREVLTIRPSDPGFGLGFELTPSGLSVVAAAPNLPNAWVYSVALVDSHGNGPTPQFLQLACPELPRPGPVVGGGAHVAPAPAKAEFQACVAKVAAKFHELVTYQPASRYWTFQALETAIFVALALILGAVSLWWIRRRIA
jgi:hypothetical protein